MKLGAAGERELGQLYDDLARYQFWRRRLSRTAAGVGLEMHKRLDPPNGAGPSAGTGGLHDWLWDRLLPEPSVPSLSALDVGCGFGASLFSLGARVPSAELDGISLSAYQIQVAKREAARLGLDRRSRFQVASFDAPLADRTFDLLLSIETLFHSPDLAVTLPHLTGALAAHGQIAIVEDMALDSSVAGTDDARELLRLWATKRIYSRGDYCNALEAAGLSITEEIDLTMQVPHRSEDQLRISSRRLGRLRAWAPTDSVRRMLDAFLGGVCLERLYGAGQMNYRCLIASATDG